MFLPPFLYHECLVVEFYYTLLAKRVDFVVWIPMRLDLADIGNIYDHFLRLFPCARPRVSTLVSFQKKKKKKDDERTKRIKILVIFVIIDYWNNLGWDVNFISGRKKRKRRKRNEKGKKIAKDRDAQRWKEWRGRVEKAILSGENRGRLHDGAFFGKKQQAKRYETCSNVSTVNFPRPVHASGESERVSFANMSAKRNLNRWRSV